MKTSTVSNIRRIISYWIIGPIALTIAVVMIVEVTGRLFLGSQHLAENAQGIVFISALVPIFAAHATFLAAVIGVASMPCGLPSDRKFLLTVIVGLAFGAFFLHGIYFK